MSKKFWSFVENESKESELILEGVVASESWYGDEVTPALFRDELDSHTGDITVRINSPGGDVFAGVSIMNMLKDRDGQVTIIVDGVAASIASVIAMAGDKIIMNTGSMMMIHNAWSVAVGDSEELRKVADTLEKIGESIISVYVARTGLDEEAIKEMLSAETWMTADEAVEMGFADEAVEGKTKLSDAVKNVLSLTKEVHNAALQPVMSLKTKLEVEEANVPDTTEEPVEVGVEESTTADAEDEEVEETTEVAEPVVETNTADKENEMTKQEEIAASQVLEPKAQAVVDEAPKQTVKDYLKTKDSMEAFARILEEQAGKTSQDVKAAWKSHLEVQMGVTNPDVFLPDALITEIEDAFKAGGEIWNRVTKTGSDVFRAAWDTVTGEDSRAKGYNREDEEEKAEELITIADRVLRPQFIYKYITLNREDVKNQRSTGALVRYVLSELPRRIVREVERAIVIGDGRAPGSDYKIDSFVAIKADATAGNAFASTYTPEADESRYSSLLKARDLIESDGPIYLVAKKGYLTSLLLEENSNGGFLFAPGTNLGAVLGFAGVIEPDWMVEDTDNDAYLVTFNNYKTVGDASIEAFTNFLLKTNKQEYLQEIYAGGGLTVRKSAVAIAVTS